MDKRKSSNTFDPLAEPLRREARLTRPRFSAALDARLRAAVRGIAPPRPAVNGDARRALRSHLLSWTIAATASIALLVGSALFCHTMGQHPSDSIVQTTLVEPGTPPSDDIDFTADLVESTAVGLGQWMETAVQENQWAGLDRDAQTAMATVTSPLPFDLAGAITAMEPME